MPRMEQYFPVPWTQLVSAQWSSGFKFGAKIQNPKEGTFSFVYLFSGCSIDDVEVHINDVLGEGDNITFMVRI